MKTYLCLWAVLLLGCNKATTVSPPPTPSPNPSANVAIYDAQAFAMVNTFIPKGYEFTSYAFGVGTGELDIAGWTVTYTAKNTEDPAKILQGTVNLGPLFLGQPTCYGRMVKLTPPSDIRSV